MFSAGKVFSTTTLFLLAACASKSSSLGTATGSGGADNNAPGETGGDAPGETGGDGAGSADGGNSTTTGTAGDGVGDTGDVTDAGGGNSCGADMVTAGTDGSTDAGGGDGAAAGGPPCPKGAGQICHEFYAADNGSHRLNYVNEFTGMASRGFVVWSVGAGETSTTNSPRTIEVVGNAKAKSCKAVLVSLETGYAEFDTTDGTKLAQVTGYTGISAACRLPTGETALGQQDDTIIVVNSIGTRVRNISLPQGDSLRAINRNPNDGTFWFSKTSIIYQVDDQGRQLWSGNMGAGTQGNSVWWREGGGAYSTTGDLTTVIEMDSAGKIVSTVGGKGAMFPLLNFFDGFVRLSNGNYVVANHLGDVPDPSPTYPFVVEFTAPPKNEIVWKWPVVSSPLLPQGSLSLAAQITNVFVLR